MAATKVKDSSASAGIYLPTPPTLAEKYLYFGKPRRWVFAWLLVAAAGILYGYVHVAEHAWVVAPVMWLLLMVMVPPVVINFWLRTGRPRLTLAEHEATVASYQETARRSTSSCLAAGSPWPLLENTLRHVYGVEWSGTKTVYVLDDSARRQVRDLAARYNFRYIVRPNPGEMKKAGNLLHALAITDGDFIAVIDADFAVREEFLYETMPYFADPKSGSSRQHSITMCVIRKSPTSSATLERSRTSFSGSSSRPGIATAQPSAPGRISCTDGPRC